MQPTQVRLSIVMPVLNEAAQIEATLGSLQVWRSPGVEVIVVDGGSSDATVALAAPLADRVCPSAKGRARQMNTGAAAATGEVLLFLHADTQLPLGACEAVLQALTHAGPVAQKQPERWGRFDVSIEGRPTMLRVVAALMNLRSRLTGIATGDQAIFMHRSLFERVGGFPDQPLMEDIELSTRLRRHAWPLCLRQKVRTSGRRWETRGVWRTIGLMWSLRWRYWRGESAHVLEQAYR
jgi:rSAM/selenodomain-associated transferase 2